MNKLALVTFTLITASGLAWAGHGAHWSYSGPEGPEHWAELDPAFSACQNGKNQSPVDLDHFVHAELTPIGFHYAPGGNEEVNNGHTVQINYRPGSTITLDGHDYELKQFHFHTPSENHVKGQEFRMEAHLVHADKDGHLAVVAVMFQEGASDAALIEAWAAMPERAEAKARLSTKTSAEALLPKHHDYYRFNGSLTTPPCTEGVTWLVIKEPVTASAEQIAKFAKVMGHPNNRPIQSLNARVVLE